MSKLFRTTIRDLQNLEEYKDINKLIKLQQYSLCETKIHKLLAELKHNNFQSTTYVYMLQKYASCLTSSHKYTLAELQLLNSYELSSHFKNDQLKFGTLSNLFIHQINFRKKSVSA